MKEIEEEKGNALIDIESNEENAKIKEVLIKEDSNTDKNIKKKI